MTQTKRIPHVSHRESEAANKKKLSAARANKFIKKSYIINNQRSRPNLNGIFFLTRFRVVVVGLWYLFDVVTNRFCLSMRLMENISTLGLCLNLGLFAITQKKSITPERAVLGMISFCQSIVDPRRLRGVDCVNHPHGNNLCCHWMSNQYVVDVEH